VDNAQNHDLKLLKKLERSKVILIVKEKWVGFINCRFSIMKFDSIWKFKFQESIHVKRTKNLHMDFFLNLFQVSFFHIKCAPIIVLEIEKDFNIDY
jgi:hypothetical protein